MGRSMADRNKMLLSISKSEIFRNAFPDFALAIADDGNPILISDKGGTSDIYGIRKHGEETKYVLKVIGLKNSVVKSDGKRNFAEEIMASIQLQMKLSVKCEAIVPIEKADVFALKYDKEGNFIGPGAVDAADDASEIAAFIIMKEYKPIVENKGQSGGSVCCIPLLSLSSTTKA